MKPKIWAVGFQARWRGKLASGAKRMTIRAERKDGRRPEVGMEFRGYVGMRTKNCELVCSGVVQEVKNVQIRVSSRSLSSIGVLIDGRALSRAEIDALAKADGFEHRTQMRDWFLPKGKSEFSGFLTEWRS